MLVHYVIFFIIYLIGFTFYVFDLKIAGLIISSVAIIYIILALFTRFFRVTGNLSYILLFKLFGRYGKVVSKEDWKNIKKYAKDFYKEAISKKSNGKCYDYSLGIALFLKDAKLMYCIVKTREGYGGHSAIVKDNCVYDTNLKRHFDYNEYIELCEVVIYKMFSEEEYRKETFIDDIWPEFVEWCKKNNVYCNPQ